MRIKETHCRTIRAGESAYYRPRERGTVEVRYDNKRYVYRPRGRYGAKAFRQFVTAAWAGEIDANGLAIIGRWPVYCID